MPGINKHWLWLAFGLLIFSSCATQTGWKYKKADNPLPRKLKKMFPDFVFMEGGKFSSVSIKGSDSLGLLIEAHRLNIAEFYINKYEVSVGEYMQFYYEANDVANQPDTFCFVKDFGISRESMTNFFVFGAYFSDPKYGKYPICGISQQQAKRYCEWKTMKIAAQLKEKRYDNYKITFRLPTAEELEYAMKYTAPERKSDWIFSTFDLNETLANSNTGTVLDKNDMVIKKWDDDGYSYQNPVKSFNPSKSDIYNLYGNVAEWTLSTLADRYVLDTTLEKYPHGNVFKQRDTAYINIYPNMRYLYNDTSYYITKGGSFAHGPYYVQQEAFIPVRSREQHSWLGFRVVMTVIKEE